MPKKEEYVNPARRWRQERIKELAKLVTEGKKTTIDALVAEFSIKYGLSERKVKEYLKILENSGQFKIDWFNGNVQISE